VRHEGGDAAERGLLVQEPIELVAVFLQRARHAVERALQQPDLVHATLGQAHREVATGQLTRHRRCLPDGTDDRLGQIAREQQDEQHRPAKTGRRRDDRATAPAAPQPRAADRRGWR
jgi:hypothetical protein